MTDITAVLQNTQNPDGNIRQQAEQHLEGLKAQDAGAFMALLAGELANGEKPKETRQAAAISLKNMLDAKDHHRRDMAYQQWLSLPEARNVEIKQMAMAALAQEPANVARAAAQVVANIALIELRNNRWKEIITTLQNNVQSTNVVLKMSSLQTIGYICEDIEPTVLDDQTNSVILTAVIQGMRKEEPSFDVRIAATNALDNAMEFIKKNVEQPAERDYIMNTICEAMTAAGSGNLDAERKLKLAAFECVVNCVALYYNHMQPYMQPLSQITYAAIQSKDEEDEGIARMAIEFWCTICDEELDLIEMQGSSPQYIIGAMQTLVPLLLNKLLEVDEDEDEDDSIRTNVGMCLTLITQTTGNSCPQIVMPFIQECSTKTNDWKAISSAIMAFGFILEGPDPDMMAPIIAPFLKFLLSQLQQPEPQQAGMTQDQFEAHQLHLYKIKYAATWTLSKIAEFHGQTLKPELDFVMNLLLMALSLSPQIANNACWGLHYIAQEYGRDEADPGPEATNDLTRFYPALMQELFKVTERHDGNEANLRRSAYEVINGVLTAGADDTIEVTLQMITPLLSRLDQTFSMGGDPQAQAELQGLLCGVFTNIINRVGRAHLDQYADIFMRAFLSVVQSHNATVHEEALMAIAAMAVNLGTDFQKYIANVVPFMQRGLQNYREYEVCTIAVGLVGDVCRSLQTDDKNLAAELRSAFVQYADQIVGILLENLQNEELDATVRPPILAVFGDIAMSLQGSFERYMAATMPVLQQASEFRATDNESLVDFMNEVHESVLDAYIGIVNGLADESKCSLLDPYLQSIVRFLIILSQSPAKEESVTRNAISLVGDIMFYHGATAKALFNQPDIIALVRDGLNNQELSDSARFASEKLAAHQIMV